MIARARTNLSLLGLVVLCPSLFPFTNQHVDASLGNLKSRQNLKIDLEMLEVMVAAGATGSMVLAAVRLQCERHEAKRSEKRPSEKERKQRKAAETKRTKAESERKPAESERHEATLSDTPRARLFREGKPALLSLNIAPSRAGALITEWLKLTNDDDQLVLATILRAQALAVAEAPGWILATLTGKRNGNGKPKSGIIQAADDLCQRIADFDGPKSELRSTSGENPPRLLSYR